MRELSDEFFTCRVLAHQFSFLPFPMWAVLQHPDLVGVVMGSLDLRAASALSLVSRSCHDAVWGSVGGWRSLAWCHWKERCRRGPPTPFLPDEDALMDYVIHEEATTGGMRAADFQFCIFGSQRVVGPWRCGPGPRGALLAIVLTYLDTSRLDRLARDDAAASLDGAETMLTWRGAPNLHSLLPVWAVYLATPALRPALPASVDSPVDPAAPLSSSGTHRLGPAILQGLRATGDRSLYVPRRSSSVIESTTPPDADAFPPAWELLCYVATQFALPPAGGSAGFTFPATAERAAVELLMALQAKERLPTALAHSRWDDIGRPATPGTEGPLTLFDPPGLGWSQVADPILSLPLEGAFICHYGAHGAELVLVRNVPLFGVLGTKITGDPNVPAGAVTFRFFAAGRIAMNLFIGRVQIADTLHPVSLVRSQFVTAALCLRTPVTAFPTLSMLVAGHAGLPGPHRDAAFAVVIPTLAAVLSFVPFDMAAGKETRHRSSGPAAHSPLHAGILALHE